MKKSFSFLLITFAFVVSAKAQFPSAKNLFEYDNNSTTRWSSPENRNGVKGAGGKENEGAKGRAYLSIPAEDSIVLLDVKQQGIINRIWITINDRSPEMLRSLAILMYWDGASKPAVAVPLADFFGMALGRMSTFHNVFFTSPEGRSFNSLVPMPFKKAARIVLRNDSKKRLSNVFFDVDYQLLKNWNPNNLYFHAYWHRDTATKLARDFELLPQVKGKGRLLGVNVGVNVNPLYGTLWWGEGEVKVYLDGDKQWPTLVGTGTEDYIADAWGQGAFFNDYTGCLIADEKKGQWSFYRYHVADPIYFAHDCRMTIQQIGSSFTKDVKAAEKAGAPMIPVVLDDGRGNPRNVYKKMTTFGDPAAKEDFALFYRTDDYSSTAYFYLDQPSNNLPLLQTLDIRLHNLKSDKN